MPLEDKAFLDFYPEKTPEEFRIDPEEHQGAYLIGGEIRKFSGEMRPVHSRVAVRRKGSLEEVPIGFEPRVAGAEAMEAVETAEAAWARGLGAWPMATVEERIRAVETFAHELQPHRDRVATLLMLEIGKPLAEARKEVDRSLDYIRHTIDEVRTLQAPEPFTGRKGDKIHYARRMRVPLGKVLCVAPFNYPVNEFLTTIIPALLMGNVVVAKTPRFGVLANLALLPAFSKAFPPGVVSVLPGSGRSVIPAVMGAVERESDRKGFVDVLAFIGSEGAATAIMDSHPSPVTLHRILGLGAKNPAIVLSGADLEQVTASVVKGALGFNGQRCTAEKLIFAPRSDVDELARRIGERVAALKLGMPWEEGVAITPLPEEDKLSRMWEYIEDATRKGARLVNPGGGRGYFSMMRPAVLCPVTSEMKIFHEEQFGPIVPIAPYDTVDEVLSWQANSPYGQQAGLWGPTEALESLVDPVSRLVARVNLNDVCQRGPDTFGFTATDKSGFGTLSIRDALMSFSREALIQSPDQTALK